MGVKAVIGDLTCGGTQWSDEKTDESLQEKADACWAESFLSK